MISSSIHKKLLILSKGICLIKGLVIYMLEQNNDIDYDSIDPNEAYIILKKVYDDMLTTWDAPSKLVNSLGVSINALKFCINNNIIVN